MESTGITPVKEKLGIDFKCFPAYARHLLEHSLPHFASELLRLYEQSDIPLLRFFHSVAPEERLTMVTASSQEMLTLIAENKVGSYVDKSIRNWLTNQVPLISREQVHSQDITLVNYAKAKVLRNFLPFYTDNAHLTLELVDEIDRFTVILDSELFTAYLDLQRQEIQQINAALTKREKQLLEAQEIGQIGSFEWDFLGKKSSYTPQVFKIFEMDGPSNLVSFLDDVHPDEREKVRKAIDDAMVDGNYECEYRYIKNNKEKMIFSRGKVQFDHGKPSRMIGTVMDVTERNQTVRKLQESEKLHKQAQALTHIGNWSWLINEDKVAWSDEMYRIYGLEPQSVQITFERFLSFVDPADREKRIEEIKQALHTLKVDEYYFWITAADGARKVLRGKGEVIMDTSNKPVAMLGTCQDITKEFTLNQQLKERERYLETLNRSLNFANEELSRTNEELESFNFIASHDLQEPLRKIQVYSNRIMENGFGQLPQPLHDYFERINNASRRMQKLIEDFLSFSQTFDKNQSAELVDMDKLLSEVRSELVTRIEEKQAQIHASSLPRVYAFPFQVKQLLTNLIGNALKYTDPGVVPEIRITGSVVPGSAVPEAGADASISYTRIAITDNGIGFDSRYRHKIFELFQRLHGKNVYSGTGIGLALCKKIVRNLNGFISADSEPGKGSTFTFYIPSKKVSLPGVDPVDRADERR